MNPPGVFDRVSRSEELDEGRADLAGRIPFDQMAGAGDDFDGAAGHGPLLRRRRRQQLVLFPPQDESWAADAMEAVGLTAVAEWVSRRPTHG